MLVNNPAIHFFFMLVQCII